MHVTTRLFANFHDFALKRYSQLAAAATHLFIPFMSCTCQNAVDDLKSDLETEVKNVLSKVLNLSNTVDQGTTVMDVTNGTAAVIRRISSTAGTTIDIVCPDGT
jgi:hypothetical protein